MTSKGSSTLSRTSRIMFGSCSKVEKPQPMWSVVIDREPDLWIWGGDNMYADVKQHSWKRWPRGEFLPADPQRLREFYDKQITHPQYREFLESKIPMTGIWDDHDYGLNDAGKDYEFRNQSKQLFLDFLGAKTDDPRRTQDGVYTYVDMEDGLLRIVLMDVRYNRDSYNEIDSGDFLGPNQWSWLETTLRESKAKVNLIVSGIQVLPENRSRWFGYFVAEMWNNFPAARQRLFNVVLNSGAKGVIFLSGDVHFAEFGLAKCTSIDDSSVVVSLPEMTSSGMTHSWGNAPWVPYNLFHSSNVFMPYRYQHPSEDESQRYLYDGLNVGELNIYWDNEDGIQIVANVLSQDGQVVLRHTYDDLTTGEVKSAAGWKCDPWKGRPTELEVAIGIIMTLVMAFLPLLIVPCCCICEWYGRPGLDKTGKKFKRVVRKPKLMGDIFQGEKLD